MVNKNDLWKDAGLLAGFLVAFEPRLTGVVVHEWLSLALAATLIGHVVLHWDWVMTVGVQFFRKLFHTSRLNFILDVLLFLAFILVMLSGILISRSVLNVLGIQIAANQAWRMIHSAAADACLILTGLHVAMHWRWILNATKKVVLLPVGRMLFPKKLQPAAAPVDVRK